MNISIEDLINENISDDWNSEIGGKPTFAGVLIRYYSEIVDMPRKWSADSTRKQYLRDYNEYVLPELNEQPLEECEREDYDKVIASVYQKRGMDCKESFVQHIRNIIRRVVILAEQKGICRDVLWGTSYGIESEGDEEELCSKELVKLRKSFTIDEEISIANAVLTDETQSGLRFGLALMFCLGVRNAEACGADFGDIHPLKRDSSKRCLWIYKTTSSESNQEHYGGKSGNVGRVIPIPSRLDDLLERRRQFLIEKVLDGSLAAERDPDESELSDAEFAEAFVDRLPIVCMGDAYTERCPSRAVTDAGAAILREVKIEQEMLALIDFDIRRPGRTEEGIAEKDPTAYACRRNLGTQLFILGLDEAEIQYIIGHEIEDDNEERSFYRNEEKLYEIALKMERRPIVNYEKDLEPVRVTESFYEEKNVCRTKLEVPIDSEKEHVKIQIRKREPQTKLEMYFDYEGVSMTGVKEVYDNTEPYGETLNVMHEYQKRYQTRIRQRTKSAAADESRVGAGQGEKEVAIDAQNQPVSTEHQAESDMPKVRVSSTTAAVGATNVQVVVCIENNPGFDCMELELRYDESMMTLKSAKNGAATAGHRMTAPENFSSGCKFEWREWWYQESGMADGEILILSFDIHETAVPGTFNISLYSGPGDIYDWNWKVLDFELVHGSIVIL